MSRRILTCLVLLTVIAILAGCGGPSAEGMKQRQQANQRINIMNAQIHYDQARQSFDVGQFDKAIREISHSIALYPANPQYHLLQGRIYLETKRLEQAIMSFNTVIEKGTAMLAEKSAGEKDKSDAEQVAKSDAEIRVRAVNAEAHYFAGIVFQRWSDNQQACDRYSLAFEIEPAKVEYLLAAAESLVALGRFDEAREMVTGKMAYFEHNAALRQLQGQIALLQGDPKQAAKLYGEARMLNPDDGPLLEDLMLAQYAAGQYGQCLESIRMWPSRPAEPRSDLTHLQARCLTRLGRHAEARDLYLGLTQSRPSEVAVWIELGTIAWGLGDYRRVAQSSVQVMALAPDRYEGYMLKGINERQKNNLDLAIGLFREACQHAGDEALPYLLLGQTLEQAGDMTSAMQAYQDALEAEPGNTDARELLRRAQQGQRITAAPTGNG